MSNVAINIAAEFTGKPAFDKAGKSANALNKTVKSLGKTIGYSLGAAALISYGKAAVKAFSEDQAAAQRLATAVSNLGYSFSQVKVEEFIHNLEKQSGILDDKLRPAFQSLLTTTGSLTISQKLLNDAIQISRASGVDLATVANDLALAYTGNTKGLKKYYTGLTAAELKTKSFSDILAILLKNSAGAADAYLSTTAYKMEVLAVATANAQEAIGSGLVDALIKISGGSTAADAVKVIEQITTAVNALIKSVAYVVSLLVKLYRALDKITTLGGLLTPEAPWVKKAAEAFNPSPSTARSKSAAGVWKRTEQQRKTEQENLKNAKNLAALAKQRAAAEALIAKNKRDQAVLDKAALALNKGTEIFNMDAIQIQAALANQTEQLGKVTNQSQLLAVANDITRLRIKQDILDLEKAIQEKDVEGATAAADKLNSDLKSLGALQGQAIKLADINKILAGIVPKDLINLANLNMAIDKLKQINAGLTGGNAGGGNWMDVSSSATVDQMVIAAENNAQFLLDMAAANEELIKQINKNPAGTTAQPTINNYFGGSVVTDQKLIDMVLSGAQLSSLSGSPSQIGRISGMFS